MLQRVLVVTMCTMWSGAWIHAADPPADTAVALAQILKARGIVTAADVASVTAAAANARTNVLAQILQRKGLLNESEIASIWNGSSTALAAKPVTPQPAPAGARTVDIPVTTHEGVGVSLYGTLLLNAFYNTASTNIQDVPLFAIAQGSDPTGGDKDFGMTARQTRLGLRLHRTNVAGATLSGQFEFDLFGGKTPFANGMDMDIFRLRLAYGHLDWKHVGFEAGQDWAIFAPLNPTSFAAYAIPEFAESGNPWIRCRKSAPSSRAAPKIRRTGFGR